MALRFALFILRYILSYSVFFLPNSTLHAVRSTLFFTIYSILDTVLDNAILDTQYAIRNTRYEFMQKMLDF